MGVVELYYSEVKEYIGVVDYMVYQKYTRSNNLTVTSFNEMLRKQFDLFRISNQSR